MKKIVIASLNKGKIQEIKHYLQMDSIELISQNDLKIEEVAETGQTFIENALIKARNVSQQTHLPVLADDSGLVIDVLNGEPGIFSARYAGAGASDEDNITKVLNALAEFPETKQREAYFYCCMVLLKHVNDPAPLIAVGKWKGFILLQPQGHRGFGYDPIFYVPEKQCSAAELNINEKNQISHRGLALQHLREQLQNYFIV